MEAVSFKNVSFTYPENEYPALKGIDFSVNKGELCLVIGESAAGKTTLLKLLKKEISPAGELKGELSVNGTVGYVSQNVDERIVCDKVRSELSFGLVNMGLDADAIELLTAETASYFNLESKLDSDISSLSGGEKQMVNLAAIMIMKPDILVLDEPCSQLDPVASQRFMAMVKRLHRDFGLTVVIAEHNSQETFEIADSVVLMDGGGALFKLSPQEAVKKMRQQHHKMLASAPVFMTLYDNAGTVSRCREILKSTVLREIPQESADGDTAIRVKGLCFAYEKGNEVINNLRLDVYAGKINAIVGPNSSGKTTLLKLISGVLKAHRGKIKADKSIAMLCQNVYDLFTRERCGDEVSFGEITTYLGIDDIKDKHPYDISGGQAQRLALAKVLETGADIILLDEPTRGLDAVVKQDLARLLLDLCASGKTILIVTHDIEFAGQYAHTLSFMSRGRIISTAPRREFFNSLNLYTTAVSKIVSGIADGIVSIDDLRMAGGLNE